jgi:tetratricopeptide (TPR) repeat protein
VAYSSEIDKLRARYNENPKGRNFAPLADAYRKARQLDEAIALCNEGLQYHPDYVSAHIVLGRCLIDKKDDVAAETSFRRVLELDPENIIALKMLSDIALRSGRPHEAVDWLTRLLQVDPMNGEAAEALSVARGQLASPAPIALERAESVSFESGPAAAGAPVAITIPELPVVSPAAEVGAASTPPPEITEAPTEALAKPEFRISAPIAAPPASGDGGLESYDGTIDFSGVEQDAAPIEGITIEEQSVELPQDVVPAEGLARTHYEGSGMFKLGAAQAAEPAVSGLPLILPEEETRPERGGETPPPAARSVPMTSMFSDDEGAADQSALSAAEPLVTETMAELYLQQGHVEDALRVYRALLASRPGDAALRAKVDRLSAPRSEATVPSPAPPQVTQTAVDFLRRVFHGAPGAPPETPASDGGSAETMLDGVFSAADDPEDEPELLEVPEELEIAEPPGAAAASAPVGQMAPAPATPGAHLAGAPTQPASDALSLDRVFGDPGTEPSRPPGAATGPAVGATTGFSFDEFFSSPEPPPVEASGSASPTSAPPARSPRAGEPDQDLDQFQAWLRSLKA